MHKPLYCLTHTADTPWGEVWLAASNMGLCGLWFQKQNHLPKNLPAPSKAAKIASLSAQVHMDAALRCLHSYIQGRPISHLDIGSAQTVAFDLSAGTPFQQLVWRALLNIPWGQQCSYGELACAIGHAGAARAVGSALAHNPISILLPCHRVISKNGKLTGYAGGLVRKQALLLHEALSPIQ